MMEKLLEYGLAGVVIAVGAVMVVGPVVKFMIAQQRDALTLLRSAVEQNTVSVKEFQRYEQDSARTNAAIVATQEIILKEIQRLRKAYDASTPPG